MEDLKEVAAPLLVVYGELDTLGIPMQQQWVEAVPNAQLRLVPNAGKSAFRIIRKLHFLPLKNFSVEVKISLNRGSKSPAE